MKNYQETMEILESFYKECVEHWKRENSKMPEMLAMADIIRLRRNPYSPNGEEPDIFAIVHFVEALEKK